MQTDFFRASGAVLSVPWALFLDFFLSGLFLGYGATSNFAPTARNASATVTADVTHTRPFGLANVIFA
jgi:hypothetical protein